MVEQLYKSPEPSFLTLQFSAGDGGAQGQDTSAKSKHPSYLFLTITPEQKGNPLSRFNQAVHTGARSAVTTVSTVSDAHTALNGAGFLRDTRSELFLLAVSNMSDPKGAFHEDGTARDARYTELLRSPAVYGDEVWSKGFIGYLRNEANLRSASVVAAAEIVRARLTAGIQGNRALVSAALQRPDEPGEFLAYWLSTQPGRSIPKPVKRGISDACQRLFTERNFLKYDSASKGFRWADILQLVHAEPSGPRQGTLYKHVLNERYAPGQDAPTIGDLPMLLAHKVLLGLPAEERRTVTAGQLAEAGFTWESLAGWLQGPMDAAAWEKIIPSMGAMALVRNLRNFDQAHISRSAARLVEDKLTNADEIKRSRQLPMRFLNAYRAVNSSGTVTGWGPVLEEALNLSLVNVPQLSGRTLILVDLSQSMYGQNLSERSDLRWVDAAAVFGAALAKRAEQADLYGFGSIVRRYGFQFSTSVLPLATAMTETRTTPVELGLSGYAPQDILGLGGTETAKALRETFTGQDRIVIITDEQYSGGGYYNNHGEVNTLLDQFNRPTYTWNLAGYKVGQAESGQRKRHTFGGLSDSSFRMINALEQGQSQAWPWQQAAAV